MGAADVAPRDGGKRGKVRRTRSRREKGLFSRWTSASGAGPDPGPRAGTRRIFFAMAIAGLARWEDRFHSGLNPVIYPRCRKPCNNAFTDEQRRRPRTATLLFSPPSFFYVPFTIFISFLFTLFLFFFLCFFSGLRRFPSFRWRARRKRGECVPCWRSLS